MVPMMRYQFANIVTATLSTFSVYYSLIVLLAAFYRLSPFHPLAKYPGPLLNKLSKLRMTWESSKGKQHLYYSELHKIYGDIVRVGPNEVSICDAKAIPDVLGVTGLPKGNAWKNRAPPGHISPLIEIRDPVEHAQHRKPWARALNSNSAKAFEPIIIDRVQELVKQLTLASMGADVVDLAFWMRAFSFDFMGRMAFDTDFEFMKRGHDSEEIWPIFESGLRRGVELTTKWVGERVKRGSSIKDLFYHLLDEDAPESERPALEAVASEGILAVVAGSDTTSTTLTIVLYYLLRHPDKLKKLSAEIDLNFTKDEDAIEFTRLAEMQYLNACINEALRLYSPVMSGSQRRVPPGGGPRMAGSCLLPEGTHVLMHTFSIHRDTRNFSNPDAFIPERWLPDARPSDIVNHNNDAFIPFSFGPQNCVGKNVAILELRAVVALIVQKFNFHTKGVADLERWEDGIDDWFATACPALLAHLEVKS
ncbi:hypothetical protein HWV62_18134 [Athelia sp. TMB]|nr:hypothetical protein HWV62_18134 [Athelia sp. TMB]